MTNRIMGSAGLSLVLACLTVFAKESAAAVPHTLAFQGVLKNVNGQSVADGTYPVKFEIYDAVGPGGGCLWLENQLVSTQGGLFSAVLGSTGQGIPDSAFNDANRWLAITVGNDPEMSPRQKLSSVGYSFRVNSVDGATGGTISGDVNIQSALPIPGNMNAPGNAGAGSAELHLGVANDIPTLSFKAADPLTLSFELFFDPFEEGVKSKTSVANGAPSAAAYRWMTQLLPQPETEVMRIDYRGDVSIGTTSSSSKLCVGGAIATAVTSTACAPITLDETNSVVLSPGSQIGCIVNLPTAVGISGRQYTIKNTGNGQTNVIPFGAQLIDGSPSYILSAPNKYVTVVSDGANWWVIGNN